MPRHIERGRFTTIQPTPPGLIPFPGNGKAGVDAFLIGKAFAAIAAEVGHRRQWVFHIEPHTPQETTPGSQIWDCQVWVFYRLLDPESAAVGEFVHILSLKPDPNADDQLIGRATVGFRVFEHDVPDNSWRRIQ